jgi:putative hydrolase of the HAD superfamily
MPDVANRPMRNPPSTPHSALPIPHSNSAPRPAFHIPDSVRVVLFDAVGTVIRPEPSVARAYHRSGARHGSNLTVEGIHLRFRQALAAQEEVDRQQAAWRTSEDRERDRWKAIVRHVFDDLPRHDALFDDLWDHFAAADHWALFDDVADCWTRLEQRGLRIGMASNFDARLHGICRALPPLAGCRAVFVSSELGHRKPGVDFFRAIECRLGCRPDELLLIGDDAVNDLSAARDAGWHAALIARDEAPTDGLPALRSLSELE